MGQATRMKPVSDYSQRICKRKKGLTNHKFTLVKLQVNGSNRLQFRLGTSLLTVCADTWDSHLSVFTCRYLGYRLLSHVSSLILTNMVYYLSNSIITPLYVSQGLERQRCSLLCHRIHRLQISLSQVMASWKPKSGTTFVLI